MGDSRHLCRQTQCFFRSGQRLRLLSRKQGEQELRLRHRCTALLAVNVQVGFAMRARETLYPRILAVQDHNNCTGADMQRERTFSPFSFFTNLQDCAEHDGIINGQGMHVYWTHVEAPHPCSASAPRSHAACEALQSRRWCYCA